MKKIIYTSAFVLMLLAQWWVPGQMIYQQEQVLEQGTAYMFKTRPVDPSDPFRGKFIVLQYEIERYTTSEKSWEYKDRLYVYIEEDSLGYAKITQLSDVPLDMEQDYVVASSGRYYDGELHINFPFNRFYMEESKAYDAEQVVSRRNNDTIQTDCYARIFIDGDRAVLENVFVDGVPVGKFVEREEL